MPRGVYLRKVENTTKTKLNTKEKLEKKINELKAILNLHEKALKLIDENQEFEEVLDLINKLTKS